MVMEKHVCENVKANERGRVLFSGLRQQEIKEREIHSVPLALTPNNVTQQKLSSLMVLRNQNV